MSALAASMGVEFAGTMAPLDGSTQPELHRDAVLPENARPLQQIAPGELVQIIAETVPIAHLPLLEAMGLCNDCELRVCQSRGTCILDVNGSRVGLSDQVAASIQAIPVVA